MWFTTWDPPLCHGLWSRHYAIRSCCGPDVWQQPRHAVDVWHHPSPDALPPRERRGYALRLAARDRPSAACWHTSCSSCNNPETGGETSNNTTSRTSIFHGSREVCRSIRLDRDGEWWRPAWLSLGQQPVSSAPLPSGFQGLQSGGCNVLYC